MTKRNSVNKSKAKPEAVDSQRRKAEALELRKLGYTFQQIADELKFNSKQAAYDCVRRALKEIIEEPAKEVLKLDLERLDAMWLGSYPDAMSGDTQAITTCLKIMERRARLLGLDAPTKQDHTSTDGSMAPKPSIIEIVGFGEDEGKD